MHTYTYIRTPYAYIQKYITYIYIYTYMYICIHMYICIYVCTDRLHDLLSCAVVGSKRVEGGRKNDP